MILAAIALATGGVAISSVPQLGVVTTYADCIAREVGEVPAAPDARKVRLEAALHACRDSSERSFASGLIKLNGKPFGKDWWKGVRKLFDAMDAEAASVILAATGEVKSFKTVWELSDGTIAEVGDLHATGPVRVRIVAA